MLSYPLFKKLLTVKKIAWEYNLTLPYMSARPILKTFLLLPVFEKLGFQTQYFGSHSYILKCSIAGMYMCLCVCVLSHVQLFVTQWTPLPVEFFSLQWVAISYSRGSSWPRDWTYISWNLYMCVCLTFREMMLILDFQMSLIIFVDFLGVSRTFFFNKYIFLPFYWW